MEITAGTIYLIALATNIKIFLLVVAFLMIVTAPVLIDIFERKFSLADGWGVVVLFAIVAVIILLMVIIPGSKTLVAMYIIPELLSVEGVDQLPANLVGFLNDYLTPSK